MTPTTWKTLQVKITRCYKEKQPLCNTKFRLWFWEFFYEIPCFLSLDVGLTKWPLFRTNLKAANENIDTRNWQNFTETRFCSHFPYTDWLGVFWRYPLRLREKVVSISKIVIIYQKKHVACFNLYSLSVCFNFYSLFFINYAKFKQSQPKMLTF